MPAAGHGPVAVADRWVRAVSPAARARGVARGMSLALARRHCPELVTYAPSGGVDLTAEVARRLEAWFGPVVTRRGGLFVRVSGPSAPGPDGVEVAERVARLLWQELGVESRIALAPTTEAARGLAALLEPGWVGVAAAAATAAWAGRTRSVARCAAGARRAAWRGAPLPDLEGAVARAALLTGGLRRSARGNLLRVRIAGARASADVRVRVPERCGRVGLARLVEGVLRREGAALGPIEAVALALLPSPSVAPAPAQVAAPLPTGLSRKTWIRVSPTSPSAPTRREPELAAAAGTVAGVVTPPARARRATPNAPPAAPPRPAQLALLPRVR
jgi:hypothetical protein